MIAVARGGGAQLADIAIICLAVALIAVCAAGALVWEKVPWWRSHPKPSRLVRDDRDRVRDFNLRTKHPEAFPEGPVPPHAFPDEALAPQPERTQP